MSTNPIDADRIGPTVDLESISIPDDVGRQMQTLYGAEEPPTTAAEWAAQIGDAIEKTMDRTPTVADLCTTDHGDHAFEPADDADGERQEYVCTLDPIAYPYITETPGTITSTTAVRREQVTITIDDSGVEADQEDALVSIGISDDVDYVEAVGPETVYQQICEYIQTFEDDAEYEEWADSVDAATTSVPLATGIGIGGALATTLFE